MIATVVSILDIAGEAPYITYKDKQDHTEILRASKDEVGWFWPAYGVEKIGINLSKFHEYVKSNKMHSREGGVSPYIEREFLVQALEHMIYEIIPDAKPKTMAKAGPSTTFKTLEGIRKELEKMTSSIVFETSPQEEDLSTLSIHPSPQKKVKLNFKL